MTQDAIVMTGIIGTGVPVEDADEALEEWMRRLTGSVGNALLDELARAFR